MSDPSWIDPSKGCLVLVISWIVGGIAMFGYGSPDGPHLSYCLTIELMGIVRGLKLQLRRKFLTCSRGGFVKYLVFCRAIGSINCQAGRAASLIFCRRAAQDDMAEKDLLNDLGQFLWSLQPPELSRPGSPVSSIRRSDDEVARIRINRALSTGDFVSFGAFGNGWDPEMPATVIREWIVPNILEALRNGWVKAGDVLRIVSGGGVFDHRVWIGLDGTF